MILNPSTHQAESQTLGTEESIAMTIDTSDQAALMMILSENLYKDPIGSLVRESVSNALDAHKEAGNNEPIIVSLKMDKSYNYVYTVQDFGTGISPDRILNIVSKYAASTKRLSNKYLGYFGLGMKAPLAYTDSFTIDTNFEGINYKYIMYKSEKGTKIDLVTEQPTDKRNGTIVNIQLIKRTDDNAFITKIKEQLAYFEGVYFDVPGINNDFTVLRNTDWKYSDLSSNKGMHICLENVYYDIDWKRLGMAPINIPIGLNFSIGDGLLPIPSREDIKYTEEAKELIGLKIAWVADYFLSKFNEEVVEAEYFGDIYNKFNRYYVTIEGKVFDVAGLRQFTGILANKPTLKGVHILNLEELARKYSYLFPNYEIRGRISNGTFYGKENHGKPNLLAWGKEYWNGGASVVRTDHQPKGLELAYLKDVFPNASFLYKRHEMHLGRLPENWVSGYGQGEDYINILNLRKLPKTQWRGAIKEFQGIIGSVIEKFPDIKDYQPTKEWLEQRRLNRKKGIRQTIGNQSIVMKVARMAMRGDHELTFDSKVYLLKDVGKTLKKLIVYTTGDKKAAMNKLHKFINMDGRRKQPRIALVILNRYDVKKVKNLQNFISMEEFMKGKNKPFKAFATAILIRQLTTQYAYLFEAKDFIKNLSMGLVSKMEYLEDYMKNNYPADYYSKNEFLASVLQLAIDNNLFDEEVMPIYKEVSEKLPIFNFISVIQYTDGYGTTPGKGAMALSISRELLRARRFRMDWENYLELNPVIIQEEEGPGDDEEDEEEDQTEDDIAEIGSVISEPALEEQPF